MKSTTAVDDGIFVSPQNHCINTAIYDIIAGGIIFEDRCYSSDYIRIDIKQIDKAIITFHGLYSSILLLET